jgi:uncharacterized membrane protein
VAKSKVKLYAIVQVLFGVTLLWLSYLFISFNGADGAVQAFCLNYLLFFVFMVYIYKKGILV